MVSPHQTPEIESSATASASKRPGIREHRKRPMFDTLQVTNDLKRGGLAEPQAEAIVSAFSTVFRDVLTKDDLKAALKDYPTKDELRAEVKAALEGYPTRDEIEKGFKDFYHRFVYIAVAIVGVNATVTAMLFGAFSMMIRSHL